MNLIQIDTYKCLCYSFMKYWPGWRISSHGFRNQNLSMKNWIFQKEKNLIYIFNFRLFWRKLKISIVKIQPLLLIKILIIPTTNNLLLHIFHHLRCFLIILQEISNNPALLLVKVVVYLVDMQLNY
jgi:hypothetical protein